MESIENLLNHFISFESTFRESLLSLIIILVKIGVVALTLVIIEQVILFLFKYRREKRLPKLKGKLLPANRDGVNQIFSFFTLLRGDEIIPLLVLRKEGKVILNPVPKDCEYKAEKRRIIFNNPILELDRLKHNLNSISLRVKPEKGGRLLSGLTVTEPVIVKEAGVKVINNSGRMVEILTPHELNRSYKEEDLKTAQENEVASVIRAYV